MPDRAVPKLSSTDLDAIVATRESRRARVGHLVDIDGTQFPLIEER